MDARRSRAVQLFMEAQSRSNLLFLRNSRQKRFALYLGKPLRTFPGIALIFHIPLTTAAKWSRRPDNMRFAWCMGISAAGDENGIQRRQLHP
ncbi:hypothetical protein CUJ84_Chr003451 [Rhizobium leguminosarum]|uniref:Uncharacterized protein n=1 Tax=Rhizobium leguminosarum TaxID=384 RepID=A0A2K9Z6C1_RHILE|nr:hypothetical protein CUJ84_Chr003451 [Rhizobium leguminosarum]